MVASPLTFLVALLAGLLLPRPRKQRARCAREVRLVWKPDRFPGRPTARHRL